MRALRPALRIKNSHRNEARAARPRWSARSCVLGRANSAAIHAPCVLVSHSTIAPGQRVVNPKRVLNVDTCADAPAPPSGRPARRRLRLGQPKARRGDLRRAGRAAGGGRDDALRGGDDLRPLARERPRPGRLCRPVDGLSRERQRGGVALLARRLPAGERRSGTAVVPYFSYGKGDKKDEPRVSIRARVLADAIEVAGADRVVAMDLHAPQIQGFFRIPVDDLYAMPMLVEAIKRAGASDPVVVSPDSGYAKMARRFARRLGGGLALADKTRPGHDEEVEVFGLLGDVAGRDAVIVDDFVASGGTLVEAAERLVERGARSVIG